MRSATRNPRSALVQVYPRAYSKDGDGFMVGGEELRSLTRLDQLGSKLMSQHDSLADLKSYFDGHGEPTEEHLPCN